MNRTPPPAAPAFEDLPPRRVASTEARSEFAVSLAIVTPILGGGYRARELDDIDIIRVPTVRGHLRFWWRALCAGEFKNSTALYEREAQLWGGPGGGIEKAPALRSPVEVRIEVTGDGTRETSDIDPQNTLGAYALFPARSERRQASAEPRPRRTGVAFRLTVSAPTASIVAVRDAVRAWILFGGYGGRTRRGLGGLTVTGPDAATWLPRAGRPLAEELRRLFDRNVFAGGGTARQTPTLAGAALSTIGAIESTGVAAWHTAVEALRLFRQGTSPDRAPASPGDWARQPGVDRDSKRPSTGPSKRPSISNWPEPDKIRRLADRAFRTGPYVHEPRHNETPVWPRAGFGLPIVGRFQTQGRNGDRYHEPPAFTLKWRESTRAGKIRERLASPLIVKALPLGDGRFVAIALWLHRAWPAGEIVLEIENKVVPGSAAPFDALVAPGDTPCFTALDGKPTLQSAFFAWLARRPGVVTVVPPGDVAGGAR